VLRAQEKGSDSFWVRIMGATSQTHEHPDQPGTGWVKFNDMVALRAHGIGTRYTVTITTRRL